MKNYKILVVDNDLVTIAMLKSALTKAGYEVIFATGGAQAIALAREHLPFVILFDIATPEMDGSEVADILRSERKTKDIPIIFLSSLMPIQEERFSTKKGSVSLMAKPFDHDRLLNEVRKHFYGT